MGISVIRRCAEVKMGERSRSQRFESKGVEMTKHPPFAWLRRGKRMTDDEERSPHAMLMHIIVIAIESEMRDGRSGEKS